MAKVIGAGFPAAGEGRWITLELETVPFPVQMRLAKASDGRVVCTGLKLGVFSEYQERWAAEHPDGDVAEAWGGGGVEREWEITARSLREIRLPEVIEYVLAQGDPQADVRGVLRAMLGKDTLIDGLVPETVARKRPGPRGHPMEHWQTVAATYREALERRPSNPHKYIAEQLFTTEQASRRWVSKCRDLGLLGPAQLGKAGELPAEKATP